MELPQQGPGSNPYAVDGASKPPAPTRNVSIGSAGAVGGPYDKSVTSQTSGGAGGGGGGGGGGNGATSAFQSAYSNSPDGRDGAGHSGTGRGNRSRSVSFDDKPPIIIESNKPGTIFIKNDLCEVCGMTVTLGGGGKKERDDLIFLGRIFAMNPVQVRNEEKSEGNEERKGMN